MVAHPDISMQLNWRIFGVLAKDRDEVDDDLLITFSDLQCNITFGQQTGNEFSHSVCCNLQVQLTDL